MNTIWNDTEKENIGLFLKKANLKIDQNNNLVVLDRFTKRSDFLTQYIYEDISDINNLFYYQNKDEIYKILKQTISIRYLVKKNKDNPLCNGLLANLANINPTDASEIFTVFNELYVQYIRVSNIVSDKIVSILKDPELIGKKIEEIKNSDVETKEEQHVKKYMKKILSYTNGIYDNELFSSLINKCNDNIKNRLLIDLNFKYAILVKRNNNLKKLRILRY